MKKLITFICIIALSAGAALAQKGVFGIGGDLLYGSEVDNFGIGAKVQYGFTQRLRGEGSFNYFFKKRNVHLWEVNANMHYLCPIAGGVKLYPIGGFTVASLDYDGTNLSTITKFGLNIGGGIDFTLSDELKFNLTAKYCILSDIDHCVFGAGLVYNF